jgi:carbonic anhydrase
MNHSDCAGFVIACMDYRIQKAVEQLVASLVRLGQFDRVSVAGGAGNTGVLFDQVITSLRLHVPELIILIGHNDCGYGADKKDLIRNFIRMLVWLPDEDEVRAFWFHQDTEGQWLYEEIVLSDAQQQMIEEMRHLRKTLMASLVVEA